MLFDEDIFEKSFSMYARLIFLIFFIRFYTYLHFTIHVIRSYSKSNIYKTAMIGV